MPKAYHLDKALEEMIWEAMAETIRRLEAVTQVQIPHGLHLVAWTPDPDHAENDTIIRQTLEDGHEVQIRIRGAALVSTADGPDLDNQPDPDDDDGPIPDPPTPRDGTAHPDPATDPNQVAVQWCYACGHAWISDHMEPCPECNPGLYAEGRTGQPDPLDRPDHCPVCDALIPDGGQCPRCGEDPHP